MDKNSKIEKKEDISQQRIKIPLWVKVAAVFSYLLTLIFLLWALNESSNQYFNVNQFSSIGWGNYANIIVNNRINALWHATFMAFMISALFTLVIMSLVKKRTILEIIKWSVLVIVLYDAYLLSRHYVKTMPKEALEDNEVIKILQTAMPHKRVALVTQSDFYNLWLTYLFPYYDIKSLNVPQMPRMPADYKEFLQAVGNNPIRLWQLTAVEFILGPSEIWHFFERQSTTSNALEVVYAYNVMVSGMVVKVLPSTMEQPGRHAVMKMKLPNPRYALLSKWEKMKDDDALKTLANTNFLLFSKALVSKNTAHKLPDCSLISNGIALTGSIDVVEYRAGYVKLKANTDVPAILRFAEKYDPNWEVKVGGMSKELLKVDYIFQGVYLEPGVNKVEFSYKPRVRGLIVLQAVAMLIVLMAGVSLIRKVVVANKKETY